MPTAAPVAYALYPFAAPRYLSPTTAYGKCLYAELWAQEAYICLVNINVDVVSSTNHHQIRAYTFPSPSKRCTALFPNAQYRGTRRVNRLRYAFMGFHTATIGYV